MNEDENQPRRSDRDRKEPDRYEPSWDNSKKNARRQEDLEQGNLEDGESKHLGRTPVKSENESILGKMFSFNPFGRKKSPTPSSSSVSSATRRANLEAEHGQKVTEKENQMTELLEELEVSQAEVDSLKLAVSTMQSKCDPTHPLYKEEAVAHLKQEIEVLSEKWALKVADHKILAARTKGKVQRLKNDIIQLEKVKAAGFAQIDEDEEQHLGSDEERFINENEYQSDFRTRAPDSPPPTSRVNMLAPQHQVEQASNNQILEMMARTLQTIAYKDSDSNNRTDKMIIRQTIGRDLPCFSGRAEEWPAFIASYQRTTDACGFSDAENIERLRKCLKGEAAKSVECMLVSPNGLSEVMKVLEKRFGQKEHIIRAMIAKAKQIPPVQQDKPETIVEFGTGVINLTATIKSLGERQHLQNPILLTDLEEKLPAPMRAQWKKELLKSGQIGNLVSFSEWVQLESEVATLMTSPKIEEKKPEKRSQHRDRKSEDDFPTAAGLISGQSGKYCVFCEKTNHYASECFKAERMTLDQKKKIIKEKNLCYKCVRPKHQAKNCKYVLKCELCGDVHVKIMCPLQKEKKTSHPQQERDSQENVVATSANYSCRRDVLLKTLLVRASGPKGSVLVRLIFDEGSQQSNIGSTTVSKIGSCMVGEELSRNVLFGGTVTNCKMVKKFKVKLESLNGKVHRELILKETPTICGDIPRIPKGPWMKELKDKKIWISDFENSHVDNSAIEILIGSDNWGQLVTGKPVKLSCGLYAVNTVFGWTLSGPVPGSKAKEESLAMTCTSLLTGQFNIQEMWSLESLGIQDSSDVKTKKEKEDATRQHFLNTVSRNPEGRYQVSLPWIENSPAIPDNRIVAEKRLISATTKLRAAGKYSEYDQIFKDWCQEGIIEEVSSEVTPDKVHYLPHRAVFKPNSVTTPVRPVFDASCKVARNPSLNECLEKGPNLLELIPSILLRFREKKIGVTADIRKAFLMIEINEQERDFLRFLWWEGEEGKFKIYRHRRVVFGASCSPFLLGAVLELHLQNVKPEYQEIARKLLKSLYVDNCVSSVDSVQQYEEFKKVSTGMLSDAKMELRQWECSAGHDSRVGSSSGDCGLGREGCVAQALTGVLGIIWNKEEDSLKIEIPKNPLPEKLTKRTILSVAHQIFDPLGFLSPVTLIPKLLIQKAWESKSSWDEDLEGGLKKEFISWWSEIRKLEAVSVTRHAYGNLGAKLQLHTFCDASKNAYAAVIFLRSEDENGVKIRILQAKSRVSPLKVVTIPRLELLGCVIAARLTARVKEALTLEDVPTHYHSDSSTALSWIRRNDEWGTFVGNRVKEILSLTKSGEWRWVPGKMNPADLPSRGCSPDQFLKSKWWEGPGWLTKSEEFWPSGEEEPNMDEVMKEKKKSATISMAVGNSSNYWYMAHSSSYMKTVRAFAYVLKFTNRNKEDLSERKTELTGADISVAEMKLLKIVQEESFGKEKQLISGLRVKADQDGLLRVQTKLIQREDTEAFRMPVILPHCHPLVDMMIREEHLHHHHAGVQFLLSQLREKYWITQGRRAIKRAIGACARCRRFATKTPNVPAAALPEDRVKTAKAFQITGIDLAGPLFMKDRTKTWIVLFTCAVYRCVHLELVTELSTDVFLLALDRFVSRRGRPATIYTDNGTNFQGADNQFKKLNWAEIETKTRLVRIEWRFNPPSAPWWGGWWERLIRSIKDLLKRMLGHSKLNYHQMETYLCEVEAVMNGRPLTYVSEDMEDLIPLTPSMFLQDVTTTDLPEMEVLNSQGLQKKYKEMMKLREALRERFRKEYLSQLVQRGSTKKCEEFKVGDVVLVGSDNQKRLQWPMAKIVELFPGKDNEIRVARVKTQGGFLVRPLQRLYPLEMSSQEAFPLVPVPLPVPAAEAVKMPEIKSDSRSRFGRKIVVPDRFGK